MKWHVLLAICASVACRPEPGLPDYSSHVGLGKPPDGAVEKLPGPFPFVPGKPRLALGLFYEGGSTEQFVIDGLTRHYYIFVIDGTGELTYSQETSSDRTEGFLSDRFTRGGTPWWGGGIVWDTATDLSAWHTLHVSLSSSAASFQSVNVGMLSGASAANATVKAANYGYTNDGTWHHLSIPFTDFQAKGFDASKVRGPFILSGETGVSGEALLVDDVYID